jgi:hypothetical protein
MRIFRAYEEYWDNFGNSTNEADYYFTEEQLRQFAKDWEIDMEEMMYEYVYEINGWYCYECKYHGEPEGETLHTGSDADGNRGWEVYNQICPRCKNDIKEI